MKKPLLYLSVFILLLSSCSPSGPKTSSAQLNENTDTADVKAINIPTVAADEQLFSKAFLAYCEREYDTVFVKDSIVHNSMTSRVSIPELLPYRKTINYSYCQDKILFELSLTRISLSDIYYIFTKSDSSGILQEKKGKAYYMLTGTSTKGRYNSHINGKKYGFKQHRRNLKIVIERDSARFVSFHYIDYEKKQENITDVPLLIRNGTEEPYAFYLHSIIQSMYLNRKPDQSMKDFYQLIGEIREKATEYRIEDDTLAYDLATYYELTEVRETLIKQGQEGRKTIDPDAVQLVPESKKYNIRALVRVSQDGKALSRRFEKYNFNNPRRNTYIFTNPAPGYRYYNSSERVTKYYGYDGNYIAILFSDGFEGINHIFTLWEKADTNLQLMEIFETTMNEGIGHVWLDTIVDVSDSPNFIGHSEGGDGGYYWGSYWVARWEKPRKLNILYQQRWSGGEEKREEIDFELSDNILSFTKKKYDYKWNDSARTLLKTDSLFTTTLINLDTLGRK